jgi:hypothetical protein
MVIPEVDTVEKSGNSKRIMWIQAIAILLTSALTLSGCATGRTGTHVEPSFEDISRINKVGLHVKVNKGFAVRLKYYSLADRHWLEQILVDNLGRFYGSLAYGGFVGYFREYSHEREATIELKPESSPVDSAEAIGHMLLYTFKTNKVFPEIELVQSQSSLSAQEGGIDTFLFFTVRRWGLCAPLGSEYETGDKAKAQLELDVNLKLVSSANGKVLWKRNELFIDSEIYTLGDFKSQAGLVVKRMGYVLQLVCRCTVNEIYRTR